MSERNTGLDCIVLLAQFHGLHVDPKQIEHAYAVNSNKLIPRDIVRISRDLKLKSKKYKLPL